MIYLKVMFRAGYYHEYLYSLFMYNWLKYSLSKVNEEGGLGGSLKSLSNTPIQTNKNNNIVMLFFL